jgi:hypothetical protein
MTFSATHRPASHAALAQVSPVVAGAQRKGMKQVVLRRRGHVRCRSACSFHPCQVRISTAGSHDGRVGPVTHDVTQRCHIHGSIRRVDHVDEDGELTEQMLIEAELSRCRALAG